MTRIGILATHPIQYYSPWYRELAERVDLTVYYCDRQSGAGQAAAGFGVEFEWDIPLLDGYDHHFLRNAASAPDVSNFRGCDTPGIGEIIRREGFDAFIVLGWYVKSFWQAMATCWRTGTPLLVRGDSHLQTTRSLPKRRAKEVFYRLFIPRFDGYLVVGERSRDYYLYYGADPSKMFFAPHSVDNDYFARRASELRPMRDEIRRAWGIPQGATLFLFAGKFIPKKRPHDFIEAIARAAPENPWLWGLMVGSGPLDAALREEVRRRELPIAFSGFLNQSEMPKGYAASDALVLPSDAGETWGLVVNEAMSSGLPALVSDVVGCGPDLVRPGETGNIFPLGQPEGLATLMGDLALDPQRLAHMGKSASEHIRRYSIEALTQGTLDAIAATRKGKAPEPP